jgi:hypothetical protein
MNASWLRKEVALKVERRVQPTSACIISGSNASTHRIRHQPPRRLERQRYDRSQGTHVTRRKIRQAMAVPPNATTDAQSRPSSNAANKTPTSSRMYISIFPSSFGFLFVFPQSHSLGLYRPLSQSPTTGVSLTYLQQIVYPPSPRLMPSAISQTTSTSRQAMHTQISRNWIMLSGVGLNVAE